MRVGGEWRGAGGGGFLAFAIPRCACCPLFSTLRRSLSPPTHAHTPVSPLSLSLSLFNRWTVNLRFLPEPIFASPALSAGLLAAHAALLAGFACTRWVDGEPGGLGGVLARFWARGFGPATTGANAKANAVKASSLSSSSPRRPPPGPALALLAAGNLAGIAAARSLHYQFYAWYAQLVPLLLWGVDVEGVVGRVVGGGSAGGRTRAGRWAGPGAGVRVAAVALRLAAWAGVEAAWNTFPATPASSGLLTALHVALVAGLALAPAAWTRVGGGGAR